MKVGVGLPGTIPGVQAETILEWAKKADAGPFSSLGALDRLVYTNFDALITLAAVAAVTQHVRLVTTVLLAPLRNTALLAKETASIDALSSGRLTLGLGVGGREDDFQAAGVPFHQRGKIFDEQLATLKRLWEGQPISDTIGRIGPTPAQSGGPEVLIGGYSPVAIGRVGRWGNGYISGGGGPQAARQQFGLAREAWKQAGREGQPRLVGCMYYALGPDALQRGGAYIHDYYAFMGQRAEMIASSLPTTLDAIKNALQTYQEIGTDEVILWPCTPDLEQLDELANLVESFQA